MDRFVSIILVNYNWKNFNMPCIESILLQSYQKFEIIFVDNASTDWSVEEVERKYDKEINNKKIVIVKNKENTWFTWWNNLWAENANPKSEYICLLNNDTTVPKDRLEELVKWIESDDNLWAVWSLILDSGYEEKIKKQIFEDKSTSTLTILWENALQENDEEKWILYTSVISGCCLLYKKEIMEKPFPEFYFAYGEDVWLWLFLCIQWYRLAICAKSIVNHFWSGSFGKKPSELKLFYGNRNQIINFLIFYKISTIIRLAPLFVINQISHIFLGASIQRIKAKIQSWQRIFKNRNNIVRLRNFIQDNRKVSDREMINLLSYKLTDNIFYANFGELTLKIINIVNNIFRLYILLFFWIFKK